MLTDKLISELGQAVKSMNMPVWVSDPQQPGCPVVFANRELAAACEKDIEDILGLPCRYTNENGKNREHVAERCAACAKCDARTTCHISYRNNGEPFLCLVTVQPLFVDGQAVLIAGCQYEFKESPTRVNLQDHAKKLASVLAGLQQAYGPARGSSHDLDIVFLNALLLRFQCANTRLKNALIRARTSGWRMTQATYQPPAPALHSCTT